jgi:large subunit ribosomal protein L25
MADRSLTAALRAETKKGAARRLRRQGRIPAVMYGHREPVLLSIDALEFSRKFQQISESTIIHLTAGGESYDVLVKDYQADHLADRINHIDFFEIERGKLLRAKVLLHFVGNPIGVREGGLQELLLHEVDVESLPKDLPERLDVELEPLAVGQSVRVSELTPPEGVRILNSPDQVVVLIAHKVEEVAPDEAEDSDEELDAADEGAVDEDEV